MPHDAAPRTRLVDVRLLGDFAKDMVGRLFEDSDFHMERFGVEHLLGARWRDLGASISRA